MDAGLRQRIAYQRLIARLTGDEHVRCSVRGSFALQQHLGLPSLPLGDLDLILVTDVFDRQTSGTANVHDIDSEPLIEWVVNRSARDLADGFRFHVRGTWVMGWGNSTSAGVGVRLDVECSGAPFLTGTTVEFQVCREFPTHPAALRSPLARFPPVVVDTVTLARQFAEILRRVTSATASMRGTLQKPLEHDLLTLLALMRGGVHPASAFSETVGLIGEHRARGAIHIPWGNVLTLDQMRRFLFETHGIDQYDSEAHRPFDVIALYQRYGIAVDPTVLPTAEWRDFWTFAEWSHSVSTRGVDNTKRAYRDCRFDVDLYTALLGSSDVDATLAATSCSSATARSAARWCIVEARSRSRNRKSPELAIAASLRCAFREDAYAAALDPALSESQFRSLLVTHSDTKMLAALAQRPHLHKGALNEVVQRMDELVFMGELTPLGHRAIASVLLARADLPYNVRQHLIYSRSVPVSEQAAQLCA